MEDTTQESTYEAPQGQAEEVATEGVEQTVEETETPEEGQSQDALEQEAEASLFETLKAQKGWESEEDLARAYREAEAKLTQNSQSAKEYREKYEAAEEILNAILAEDVPEDYDSTAQVDPSLERDIRALKGERDFRAVAEKYDDFAQYKEGMAEIISNMSPEQRRMFQNKEGVELIYKMAKANSVDRQVQDAKSEGKKEVTLKEIEKARATVADGTKAKRPGKKVFTREEIAAMSLEEYNAHEAEIKSQIKAGLIE